MANEVKILINAVDQTSQAMGGIVGSFTEFNSALSLIEKGLGYVDKAFDATVGQFTKYAEQVTDLSRVTGMSADETSRLIQVADDLFVEFGSLKTAARQLASDGMIPNIDTLAKLSDEYLGFASDTDRVAWATKTFGRNYAEMTKILEAGGDALREAASNQPGGLILSDEDLQNAKEYKQQLDQLNDTFQAIAITIGKAVVPALTSFLGGIAELLQGGPTADTRLKRMNEYLSQFSAEAHHAGQTWEEFNKFQQDYINTYGKEVEGQINQVTEAEYELSVSIQQTIDQQTLAYTAMAQQAEVTTTTTAAIEEYTNSTSIAWDMQQQITAAVNNGASALRDEAQAAKDAAESLQVDLTGAYEDLAQAQADWSLKVGEQAISAIDATEGMTKQQVDILEAATDSIMGTTKSATDQMAADIQAAIDAFKQTGDVDAYKEALQGIRDKFESTFAPAIDAAQLKVDNLKKALDLLGVTNVHIPVYVDVYYPNGVPPGGSGGGGGGTGPNKPPGQTPTMSPLSGGGATFNIYPATESAARAAMAALIAQTQAERINTRMSA